MNPVDNLPLRDIHLPDAVSWWPPAMGWWFLLLFILILIWGLFLLQKKMRKPVLKKSAEAEIEAVINAFHEHKDNQLFIQQLSVSLRRIGISYLPRNQIAGVAGFEWYRKINQLVEKNQFSDDMIKLLTQGPYQKNPNLNDEDIKSLLNQTEQWVVALSREKSSA